MRRIALAALGGFVALASTSCSDGGSGSVLADVAWQLTCTGSSIGACTPTQFPGNSNPRYDYRGTDGSLVTDRNSSADLGTLSASCRATDLGGGKIQLSLRAATDNGYLEIQGLNVTRAGVYQPSACRATFFDGLSTYGGSTAGGCSDQAPSAAAPCQISNIIINHGDPDGPSVDLDLFCADLPNESIASVKTSVRDSLQQAQPAFIHMANCAGI